MKQTISPHQNPKKSPLITWSPLTAVAIVVASYFGTQYAGAISLFLFGLARGLSVEDVEAWLTDSTAAQFANVVLVYGLMTLAVYLFMRKRKVSLRTLGVVRARLKDMGIALLGVPVYIFGYAVLLIIMSAIFSSIDLEQEQQLGFNPEQNSVGLVLTFISLVVLPPLIEEFIMRGFLFTSLLARYRFAVAAITASIVFAVAHLQFGSDAPLLWVAAIDTFILSLVLCYMRFKTGSLWPGIFLHGLKNLVAFLSIFVFRLA